MRRAGLAAALAVAAPLVLAGCASEPPVPTSFPALDYSYLPPITLKVESVKVRDEYLPGPNAAPLIAEAPEAPATVLARMARERLVGNGSPGMATFVIRRAALNQVGDTLQGTMAVELNVSTSTGQRVGFAAANVSRSVTAPSNETPDRMRAALYRLTKEMMSDMNVELQYQIQKGLPAWLAYEPSPGLGTGLQNGGFGGGFQSGGIGGPPAYSNGGIEAQPLSTPDTGTGQPIALPGAGMNQ